jgi:biotin transporter BioY
MNFEQEIQGLKERNIRVEADKAWETSLSRKVLILVTTYVVASLAMYVIGVPNFYLTAIIPTLGFFLSTLSFPFFKRWWIQKYFPKEF